MSSIFGGSKQQSQSTSDNRAYGQINQAFSPMFSQASGAANKIQDFLGGDSSGFNKFKDVTGFDFTSEQGSRGITGNAAANGLLRSGATGKSLVEYGNNIQNQYASDYINQLMGLGNMGFQAGSLVTGAGQRSQSTSKSSSKPGIAGTLGQLASGFAMSDRRLKKNITKIGKYGDVNLYTYSYIHEENKSRIGVMADEVAKVYPEALGPARDDGYLSVDYDKLNELVKKAA